MSQFGELNLRGKLLFPPIWRRVAPKWRSRPWFVSLATEKFDKGFFRVDFFKPRFAVFKVANESFEISWSEFFQTDLCIFGQMTFTVHFYTILEPYSLTLSWLFLELLDTFLHGNILEEFSSFWVNYKFISQYTNFFLGRRFWLKFDWS